MSKRLLLVLLLTVAAGLFTAAPALATTQTTASENWAGYVVTPTKVDSFSAVSGAWTEPAATCTDSDSASYAAFWVGLGGGSESSDALEQIGTQADCTSEGTTSYYAWYELVPAAPVKLKLTIHPGDKLYARVAVNGDAVTLYLADRTSGQSVSKTLTMSSPTPDASTAEWVAEAPSACANGTESQCATLTLADFGSTTFTDAHATAGGHTGSIDDSDWKATRMELAPAASSLLGGYGSIGAGYGGGYGGGFGYSEYNADPVSSEGAAPTKLSSHGTSFTVKYGASLDISSGFGDGAGSTSSTGGYGYPGGSGDYGSGGDGYGGYGGYGYGGYGGYGYGGYYGY